MVLHLEISHLCLSVHIQAKPKSIEAKISVATKRH